jgi:hypothetical protein
VWGGVRFYFGQPGKTLQHRDREDIAPLWMNVTDKPSSTDAGTTTSGPTTTSSPTTTSGPTTTSAPTTTDEPPR